MNIEVPQLITNDENDKKRQAVAKKQQLIERKYAKV